MKNEIKEIHISFPGQILDYVDTKEHLLDLFNYITNLQQENERLKEIEKFKFSIRKDETKIPPIVTKNYKREYEDYKTRCEKIRNYVNSTNFVYDEQYKKKDKIENILKGSENNEC